MPEEKDPVLFYRADQPPGTITLFVMVKRPKVMGHWDHVWAGESRDLKIGSAEHLRYSVQSAVRETDLTRKARSLSRDKKK